MPPFLKEEIAMAEAKKAAPKTTPKAAPASKLVKMHRESDGKTVDVHPSEVENYRTKGDFRVS